MANWRDYSVQTRTALAALSQDSCYFPGCRTPILVFLGDRPAVNVDIARIRSAGPGRPRYVAGARPETVDSFGNLLLLCVPHRKAVDRDDKAHPIDLLVTWKARREGDRGAALSALGTIEADQLDALLTTAFSLVQGQVATALARFEEADPESAHLVRQLMDDLRDQRRHPDQPGRAVEDQFVTLIKTVQELREQHNSAVDLIRDVAARLANLDIRPGPGPARKRTNIGWVAGT